MSLNVIEALGPKIRRQRRRLGLTLDELTGRTGISKPYLSLIETGRVQNPPSDEKLRRLEQTLGFATGELITQAHLHRTPLDVRAVLQKLMAGGAALAAEVAENLTSGETGPTSAPALAAGGALVSGPGKAIAALTSADLAVSAQQRAAGSFVAAAIPVIHCTSGTYPQDFADLTYPARVAEQYVSCPDVNDAQAFAVRVLGDSMIPKYQQGDIVILSPNLVPREGDDCFVRFADGKTTFSRIFYESDADNRPMLRLQPRNERHRARIVPSETVAGLYRAVYRYQRVDED